MCEVISYQTRSRLANNKKFCLPTNGDNNQFYTSTKKPGVKLYVFLVVDRVRFIYRLKQSYKMQSMSLLQSLWEDIRLLMNTNYGMQVNGFES